MARSFIQSLLAAAVAVVVGGSALAQDPLKDAIDLIRLSKTAEAKAKLRELLQSDPSNLDAYKLYQSVSQDEFLMLLTGDDEEVRKFAQSILDRVKVERATRSRDAAAIQALVDTATNEDNDFGARRQATYSLLNAHGEFAVPALVEKLGSDDEKVQIQAVLVLSQMGSVAVLPLVEALKSSKELVVQNAAAALTAMPRDRRIDPAMAHLATDSRDGVRKIALNYWKGKAPASAADLMVAQAMQYMKAGVPAGGQSDVVWSLVDDKLVAADVHPMLYSLELAKGCAGSALQMAPQSKDAVSVIAQANLAQSYLIATGIAQGDESMKPLEALAAELRIAALSTGLPALRAALKSGIDQGLAPVALGAIDALGVAETADTVGDSTLKDAIASSDKRVKYAAAEALVRAAGGVNVPNSAAVVAVLADAVAEESVRTIHVIDPTLETKEAVSAASSVRGQAVDASSNAVNGMMQLLTNPNVDVVVINDILPDRNAEDVIGNIKKDVRMANTRIVVIAKDVEAAKTKYGESVHGVLQSPISSATLLDEVKRVLEGVSNSSGARAEVYAKGASESLLALAAKKSSIEGALDSLSKQMLNRPDAVAVPAARALGLSGSTAQLEALVGALKGGSADVQKAAAEAIGAILARGGECAAMVTDALVEVVTGTGDAGLRGAAAVALGKANLDAAKAIEVQQKLRKVAGAPKAEG